MTFKVIGVGDCLRAFDELPRTVQNKHMRIGLNAAAGVIRDAAVANAPQDTGLLKRAQKVKVKIPNASYNRAHHGKPAYAVIGTSRRFVGVQTFKKSGARGKVKTVRLKGGQGLATTVRRASRYSHLAERSSRYLSRARNSHGEAAKEKMLNKLRDGVMAWARTRRQRALTGV